MATVHSCEKCSNPTNNPRFCSRKCAAQNAAIASGARTSSIAARNVHPCVYCGKPTQARKFCSNLCSNRGTSAMRAANRRAVCEERRHFCDAGCGQRVKSRHAQCCSRACSDKLRQEQRKHPCRRCSTPTLNQAYCSHKCWSEHTYETRPSWSRWVTAWLAGETTTEDEAKHWGVIREYLLLTRGERCARCGWSERNQYSGYVYLEIDHHNGNKTNCRPENLEILCPNHHSLTPTYQHLNNRDIRQRQQSRRAEDRWPSSILLPRPWDT